jgi:hypothetical protein
VAHHLQFGFRWLSFHQMPVYLADLASSKGMRFATFDTGIKHTAAQVIA